MQTNLCLIVVFSLAMNSAYSQHSQYSKQHSINFNAKKSHQQSSVHTNVNHKTSLSPSGISEKDSRTLHKNMELKGDGTYHYDFETSNGIKRNEQGEFDGTIQGSSSYVSPEGIEIKTTYVADENGFHPIGDHIPKIPDYIARSLEYIRNHPYIEKDYYTGEVKKTSFDHKKLFTTTNKDGKNERSSTKNLKNNFRY